MNAFLETVVATLEDELAALDCTTSRLSPHAVLATVLSLGRRCQSALCFSECNATALRKISKKFDKKSASCRTSLQAVAIGWLQTEPFCVDLPIRLHLLQDELIRRVSVVQGWAALQVWAEMQQRAALL